MPGLHSHSPAIDYLNILSEISGFIDSCRCDVNIIVGDFNVDFDRRGLYGSQRLHRLLGTCRQKC